MNLLDIMPLEIKIKGGGQNSLNLVVFSESTFVASINREGDSQGM